MTTKNKTMKIFKFRRANKKALETLIPLVKGINKTTKKDIEEILRNVIVDLEA